MATLHDIDPVIPSRTDLVQPAAAASGPSWRSILAGFFAAFLSYVTLMSLGLAFWGANLGGVIQGPDTASGLGIGTVAWSVAFMVISLFVGGYVASRSTFERPAHVGRIQAAVVASLFFGFVLMQLGGVAATFGRVAGSGIGAVGDLAGQAAGNSQIVELVENNIGDRELKAPIDVVAKGLAARILRGDMDSATGYLASQTGLSREEARTRVDQFKEQVEASARDAGLVAAKALQATGWVLFLAMLLGTLASVLGASVADRVARRARGQLPDRRAPRARAA